MAVVSDGQTFGPIAATTSPFNLKGGLYDISYVLSSGTGTWSLQALGPDAATYMVVPGSAFSGSAFTGPFYLAAGLYKFVVSGSSPSIYANVAGIPI